MLVIGSNVYHLRTTAPDQKSIPVTQEEKLEALELIDNFNRTTTRSGLHSLQLARSLSVQKFNFDFGPKSNVQMEVEAEAEAEKKVQVETKQEQKQQHVPNDHCSLCFEQVFNYKRRHELNISCEEGDDWFMNYSTNELVCFKCASNHEDICPRCDMKLMEVVPIGYGFYNLLNEQTNYPGWKTKTYDSEIVCIHCGNLSKHPRLYPTAFKKLKDLTGLHPVRGSTP